MHCCSAKVTPCTYNVTKVPSSTSDVGKYLIYRQQFRPLLSLTGSSGQAKGTGGQAAWKCKPYLPNNIICSSLLSVKNGYIVYTNIETSRWNMSLHAPCHRHLYSPIYSGNSGWIVEVSIGSPGRNSPKNSATRGKTMPFWKSSLKPHQLRACIVQHAFQAIWGTPGVSV